MQRGVVGVPLTCAAQQSNGSERMEQVSFAEQKVVVLCKCLEVGMKHEDEVDDSQWQEGISFQANTNCLCGHTGRTTGPDFRPATEKTCTAGRACYRPRVQF